MLAAALTLPLFNPHVVAVGVSVTAGAVAAVTLVVCDAVQPLASVTVKPYVPAPTLLMDVVVAVVVHTYVNGAVPLATVDVTLPFVCPQVALVGVNVNVGGGKLTIVDDCVAVHPTLSVTVTIYVLAARLLMFCVVAALLQLYVYPGVPPDGDDVIDPLLRPHVASVGVKVTVGGVVVVNVVDAVAVHPIASVIVTL